MPSASDIIVKPPEKLEPRHQIASWYTPGFSDGLGDRLLMFDNTSASSLELLRFKREFGNRPGFEPALLDRVDALEGFRHPSIARVRKVEWLGPGEGPVLVSNHTAGRRLSDVLHEARGALFAMNFARQMTPVLAALHAQGDGVAHGALSPDRIVVTAEGRLVMVEHVIGAALSALQLPASRLRSELGLAVPPGGDSVPLDAPTDVVQIGFIALCLLAGRRLSAEEYPDGVGALLADPIMRDARGVAVPARLRSWLQCALRLTGPGFASAEDALAALDDPPRESDTFPSEVNGPVRLVAAPPPTSLSESEFLSEESAEVSVGVAPVAAASAGHDVQGFVEEVEGVEEVEEEVQDDVQKDDVEELDDVEAPVSTASVTPIADYLTAELPVRSPTVAPPPAVVQSTPEPVAERRFEPLAGQPELPGPRELPEPPGPGPRRIPWSVVAAQRAAAIFAAIALIEAFVIVGLVYVRRAPAPAPGAALARATAAAPVQAAPSKAAAPAPVPAPEPSATPPSPAVSATSASATPAASPSSASASAGPPAAAATVAPGRASAPAAGTPGTAPAAAAGRFGGVRVSSPFEVQVFEGGKPVGSSSGPMAITAGGHTFDLVNDTLAFHSRASATVRPGEMATITVTPPTGHMSVNALPWAEVWIDGKQAGETPLGNLSLPIGEHQVVFRHPQFPEQHQTAIVRAEGITRVSANLQR